MTEYGVDFSVPDSALRIQLSLLYLSHREYGQSLVSLYSKDST